MNIDLELQRRLVELLGEILWDYDHPWSDHESMLDAAHRERLLLDTKHCLEQLKGLIRK